MIFFQTNPWKIANLLQNSIWPKCIMSVLTLWEGCKNIANFCHSQYWEWLSLAIFSQPLQSVNALMPAMPRKKSFSYWSGTNIGNNNVSWSLAKTFNESVKTLERLQEYCQWGPFTISRHFRNLSKALCTNAQEKKILLKQHKHQQLQCQLKL